VFQGWVGPRGRHPACRSCARSGPRDSWAGTPRRRFHQPFPGRRRTRPQRAFPLQCSAASAWNVLAGEVQKLLVPHGHSPLIAWSPWLQGKLEFMGSKKKPLCDAEFREGAVRAVCLPGGSDHQRRQSRRQWGDVQQAQAATRTCKSRSAQAGRSGRGPVARREMYLTRLLPRPRTPGARRGAPRCVRSAGRQVRRDEAVPPVKGIQPRGSRRTRRSCTPG